MITPSATRSLLPLASILLLAFPLLAVDPPGILNHQGRIAVAGVNHDGGGFFKFALVNAAGDTTYWSNDGTSAGGSEPAAGIETPVSQGHYSVPLGDTSYHANMTAAIPKSVFADYDDVRLCTWFSADGSSYEKLSPSRRVASVGYALSSGTAGMVADGVVGTDQLATAAITLAKIAFNAVDSSRIADGSITAADLAANSVVSSKIASGAVTTSHILDGTITSSDISSSFQLLNRTSGVPWVPSVGFMSSSSGLGSFSVGPHSGNHLAFDTNEVGAYNNNTPSRLYLGVQGGGVDLGNSGATNEFYGVSDFSHQVDFFGDVYHAGSVGIGDSTPDARLHVATGASMGATSGAGYAIIGPRTGSHISIDNDDIQYYSNDTPGTLFLNYYGGAVNIANSGGNTFMGGSVFAGGGSGSFEFNGAGYSDSTFSIRAGGPVNSGRGKFPFVVRRQNGTNLLTVQDISNGFSFVVHVDNVLKPGGGSWAALSDARAKDVVGDFQYGLDAIGDLRTCWFKYNGSAKAAPASDTEYCGFVAQEVREIIPEAVSAMEDGLLTLNLDPIYLAGIRAIQELDVITTEQSRSLETAEVAIGKVGSEVDEVRGEVGEIGNGVTENRTNLVAFGEKLQDLEKEKAALASENETLKHRLEKLESLVGRLAGDKALP